MEFYTVRSIATANYTVPAIVSEFLHVNGKNNRNFNSNSKGNKKVDTVTAKATVILHSKRNCNAAISTIN